ncbi:MAG: hypothetical protein DMG60_12135 [Acidobacteria bacterium]|nr:MAG: hypothetical protein DMG60_12135 [Acidobacteriota bacterium]
MGAKNLFNDAKFVGQAEGDKRSYYVYQTPNSYLVATAQRRNNYSVTAIQLDSPDVIGRKFKGKEITVNSLKSSAHRPDLFKEYFDRLNALYVMVALGKARKLKKREGRAMVFKIT